MRTCTKCKETKPVEEFPVKPDGSPRSQCKMCRNAYMRSYYTRSEVAEKQKARVRNNPNRTLNKERYQAKLYGFDSVEAYRGFIESHPATCFICEKRPANCTDHSHETGEARGRLCPQCNLLLGNAEDSVDVLERAILYLRTR